MHPEIEKKLLALLSKISSLKIQHERIKPTDNVLETFGIDSLGAVRLFIEIEKNFGISFGDEMEDIDSLQEYSKLVDLIAKRTNP